VIGIPGAAKALLALNPLSSEHTQTFDSEFTSFVSIGECPKKEKVAGNLGVGIVEIADAPRIGKSQEELDLVADFPRELSKLADLKDDTLSPVNGFSTHIFELSMIGNEIEGDKTARYLGGISTVIRQFERQFIEVSCRGEEHVLQNHSWAVLGKELRALQSMLSGHQIGLMFGQKQLFFDDAHLLISDFGLAGHNLVLATKNDRLITDNGQSPGRL
jgi:hypothetical protein